MHITPFLFKPLPIVLLGAHKKKLNLQRGIHISRTTHEYGRQQHTQQA